MSNRTKSLEESLATIVSIMEEWRDHKLPDADDVSGHFHSAILSGVASVRRLGDNEGEPLTCERIYPQGVLCSSWTETDDIKDGENIPDDDMDWVFLPWSQVESIKVPRKKRKGEK